MAGGYVQVFKNMAIGQENKNFTPMIVQLYEHFSRSNFNTKFKVVMVKFTKIFFHKRPREMINE